MSQFEVFEILLKLGHPARAGEIAEVARKMYPRTSLHQHIGKKLSKLRLKGVVSWDRKTGKYAIIDQHYLLSRNIVSGKI